MTAPRAPSAWLLLETTPAPVTSKLCPITASTFVHTGACLPKFGRLGYAYFLAAIVTPFEELLAAGF